MNAKAYIVSNQLYFFPWPAALNEYKATARTVVNVTK